MARGKKTKKELTQEEWLEQALVPEEEWPYRVPENWQWVKLGHISNIIMGQSPPGKDTTDDSSYMPLIGGAADMGVLYPLVNRYTKTTTKASETNDLIICIRATLGRPIFSDGKYCLGRGVAAIRPFIGKKEFYRYLLLNFEQYLYANATGTTFAQVNSGILQKMPVPLPPFAEQQRIVDHIESLFTKLDKAKEKMQLIVNSFEQHKSAILHKAFTGELTKQWRKKHGVELDSWESVTSKQLFEYVTSGSRGWAQYYSDSGAVFFRMGNLNHGTIELDMSDIQYVNLPDKVEGQRSLIRKNDILISITADVGMIGLVRNIAFEGYINQHIALARPVNQESAEFIAWYLVSNVGFRQFHKKQRGATKVGLGLNDIRTLCLDMPMMDEQREILHILNDFLVKERQAKKSAENVLAQIDVIKKSILAKAFCGELGTNDPTEESAKELLKRVYMDNKG